MRRNLAGYEAMGEKGERGTSTMSPSRRRARRGNILLSTCAFFASALLCEFLLRFVAVANPRVPSLYRVPHAVLGWSLAPDVSFLNPLPEGAVRVTYNSDGWRDLDHPLEAPGDRFRVVVLGDSFMEGYSVDLEETFHRRLEARLRESGLDAETINLGVAGFGSLQEYLAYRDTGRRFAPDLVLLGFCVANDLRNNSRELEAMLGANMVKLRGRPFLDPEAEFWQVIPVDIETTRRHYEVAKTRRSSLLHRLYTRSSLLQVTRTALATLARGHGSDTEASARELALYGVHSCRTTPEYEGAWGITSRILDRLRDAVAEDGARLVVFDVPTRRETSPPHMAAIEASSTDPTQLCLAEAPGHRRLASTLEELEIPYIELLPTFRQALSEKNEPLFRNSDRHWNAQGHSLASEQVFHGLERLELLGTGPGGME